MIKYLLGLVLFPALVVAQYPSYKPVTRIAPALFTAEVPVQQAQYTSLALNRINLRLPTGAGIRKSEVSEARTYAELTSANAQLTLRSSGVICEADMTYAREYCLRNAHNDFIQARPKAYIKTENRALLFPTDQAWVSSRSKAQTFGWIMRAGKPGKSMVVITFFPEDKNEVFHLSIDGDSAGVFMGRTSAARQILLDGLMDIETEVSTQNAAAQYQTKNIIRKTPKKNKIQSVQRAAGLSFMGVYSPGAEVEMAVPTTYELVQDTLTPERGQLLFASQSGLISLTPTATVCDQQYRANQLSCMEKNADQRHAAAMMAMGGGRVVLDGVNDFTRLAPQDEYLSRIGRSYSAFSAEQRVYHFFFLSPVDDRLWVLSVQESSYPSSILTDQTVTQQLISSVYFPFAAE